MTRYLNNTYNPTAVGFPCTFQHVSSVEIANAEGKLDKTVSLFLHRITTSEHFRSVNRLPDAPFTQPVLYLDLHYLLSYWEETAQSAEAELKILTWTMQQLQSNPILDTSVLSLSAGAGWAPTDTVQLVPADISLQDVMDIWNGLGPKYRLTIAYVVRGVRVDQSVTPGMPVVATRFTVQNGDGS